MVDDLLEKIEYRYEERGYVVKESLSEYRRVSRNWAEEQDRMPEAPTKFHLERDNKACFDKHYLTTWVRTNKVSIDALKTYKSQREKKTLYQQRLQELGKRDKRDDNRMKGWIKLFCGKDATPQEVDKKLVIMGKTNGPCHKCGRIWHTRGNHHQSFCHGCLKSGHRYLDCELERQGKAEDAGEANEGRKILL